MADEQISAVQGGKSDPVTPVTPMTRRPPLELILGRFGLCAHSPNPPRPRAGPPPESPAVPADGSPASQLEQALRQHDWHWHFSDDFGVQCRGEESEAGLLALAPRCAPETVRALWARYRPDAHSSPACPAGSPVPTPAPDGPQMVEAPSPAALPADPWDQAKADRLLTAMREAADRARREHGGRFPPALANVVADALRVAEGYVQNHEAEAARGWDALELLCDTEVKLRELLAANRPARKGR
jgi:hypothetical protein